jgi:hypothetical protein
MRNPSAKPSSFPLPAATQPKQEPYPRNAPGDGEDDNIPN